MRHIRRFNAVHEDLRTEIDAAEMEQNALFRSIGRHIEHATIPQLFVRLQQAFHAGNRRFNREWNENLARPFRRTVGFPFVDCILPQPVQILPVLTDKMRPWIFPPRVFRRDLLAPWRHQLIRLNLVVAEQRQ